MKILKFFKLHARIARRGVPAARVWVEILKFFRLHARLKVFAKLFSKSGTNFCKFNSIRRVFEKSFDFGEYDLILICGNLSWFRSFLCAQKRTKEAFKGTLSIGFP